MYSPIQVKAQMVDQQLAIINLAGDLTVQAEKAVKAVYEQVSAQNVSNIVFNFNGDNYVNSAGLTILIKVVVAARQKNQHLRMTVPNAHLQKIFSLIGLNQYANIYNTLDEALLGLIN